MEALPKDTILEFGPNTLEDVRREIGLDTPERVDEAIDILDDWVKKQNHFVKKDFPRGYLERMLIISKGSPERAKEKIEKMCTFRTLMPDFFTYTNIDEFSVFNDLMEHSHLLKLTKEGYRVYMIKLFDQDFDSSLIMKYYKIIVQLSEYFMKYDYCCGFQIILDYRYANILNFVTKINPLELSQMLAIVTQGYGMRIKGIHLITASKMVDALIVLFKQVLSSKLASRIHVHKDLNTLHDLVNKEVLPAEYGGTQQSLKELSEKWLEVLGTQEYKEYYDEMQTAKTDETCRQLDSYSQDFTGVPGSFRTLTVD